MTKPGRKSDVDGIKPYKNDEKCENMKQNRVEWPENITATWVKVKVETVVRLWALPVLVLFASCGEKNSLSPKDEVLISAYLEILEARKQPVAGADSLTVIDSLLSKHGFSSESFETAIKERSAKPEDWVRFYQEVTRKLEEAEKRRIDSSATKQESRSGSS